MRRGEAYRREGGAWPRREGAGGGAAGGKGGAGGGGDSGGAKLLNWQEEAGFK